MPTTDHTQFNEKTPEALLALVAKLTNELHPNARYHQGVTLESTLDKDLGFDSLARVELIVRVEKTFNLSLSDNAFAQIETVADILSLMEKNQHQKRPFDRSVLKTYPIADIEQRPDKALTLIDVLNWHLENHPERPHIEMYEDAGLGQQINFSQLAAQSYRVAWGLLDKQIEPGARVTLMLPTSPDYFYSFMGVLAAGAVPVPIYPPTRLARIESYIRRHQTILENCQAQVMITTPQVMRFANLLKSLAPSIRHIVTVSDFANFSHRRPKIKIGPNDIAFIQYTSGSTADPKGVKLSHANLLANIRAMGQATQLTSQDIFVSWLPLYHDMGLIGAWLGNFYHSARLVVMSPLDFLVRPQRWLWAIHRYRATISAAPNFAYDLCIHRIDEAEFEGLDLSSWRIACNGAEPVVPDTVRKFIQRFSAYGFKPRAYWPVYGLAEASVGLAFPKPELIPTIQRIERDEFVKHGKAKVAADDATNVLEFVACGEVLKGHQMRIVDDNDRELPDQMQGHLQFNGPSATVGYFDNPLETKKLYHGDWLDTGDLAYLNAGQLFLTGRIKDIIIRRGRNIYPHEIEDAVNNVTGIRRGRVVAFGTQQSGGGQEQLIILAETRETDSKTREQIRQKILAACSDIVDLPPDDIVLAPPNTVLKTSSGKLRRSACCDLYCQGKVGKKAPPLWWQLVKIALSGAHIQLFKQWQNIGAFLYSGFAWLVFLLVTIIFSVCVFCIPGQTRRRAFASGMSLLLSKCCRIPIEVIGAEHFQPDTASIFVANHASYLDAFCLVAKLPYRFRFVAKAELLQNTFSRIMLNLVGVDFVERFDREQSIRDASKLEQLEESLLFFPEGTFTRKPGLGSFHLGAFIIAAKTRRPVIPITITGTRSILRANNWFVHKGKVTITIGRAVQIPEGDNTWQVANRLKAKTRAEILRHCNEPDIEND